MRIRISVLSVLLFSFELGGFSIYFFAHEEMLFDGD